LKWAKRATARAEIVIFSLFSAAAAWRQVIRRESRFRGSSLPISLGSAISATFIARLIKGCRVDVRAGCFISEITKHFQRSNEHFSRESAPLGAFFLRQ
jgi:hypothetical protein